MNQNIDILDRLQEEEGYIRLVLTDGRIIYGLAQCVVYDEDENGWDTEKRIMLEPYPYGNSRFFGIDDIASYECVKEEDIPLREC